MSYRKKNRKIGNKLIVLNNQKNKLNENEFYLGMNNKLIFPRRTSNRRLGDE